MSPNNDFILNSMPVEPVSRTYQYRKIMKPMLERKRRARINKCLDELKILMTGTLIADGENISKLEKADILEFTVRHLQRLRQNNDLFVRQNDTLKIDKFWDGFQYCATEVTQFLYQYDCKVTSDVVKHILNYASKIAKRTPQLPQPVANALTSLNLPANREFLKPKPLMVDQRFSNTITTVNACHNVILSSNQKKSHIFKASKANASKDCTVKLEVDMDVNVDVEVEVEVEVEDSNNVWRPW